MNKRKTVDKINNQTKKVENLPLFLNKDLLNLVAKTRERKITENAKFLFLKNRDVNNLIKASINEKVIKNKEMKRLRKKKNNLFHNQALLTLNTKGFIDDILNIARKYKLDKTIYIVEPEEFYYQRQTSPAINAWHYRMECYSIERLHLEIKRKKENESLGNLYIKSYVPTEFDKKLLELMVKYGLEFFWYESIIYLLITGVWYLPKNASVIFLEMNTPNKCSLSLGIYSITTIDEIKSRWKEIDSIKKEMFPTLKKRVKHKDIKAEYSEIFKLEDGLEEVVGSMTQKERNAYKKKIKEAEKSNSDFIDNNSLTPENILKKMILTEQYGKEIKYIF